MLDPLEEQLAYEPTMETPDVRYVQEQLGHAQRATTQICTLVAIRTLETAHAATHPGRRCGEKAGTARWTSLRGPGR